MEKQKTKNNNPMFVLYRKPREKKGSEARNLNKQT